MFFQLKLLNRGSSLAQHEITPGEIQFLQEVLSADCGTSNIRLRDGEYQYILAKAIASFQLKLHFPDVKEIIERLYGEEKTNDIQFIRKIQTILKKMERGNVLVILPKKKPWELQRYALSSFKFEDVDRNQVVLATDQQTRQMQTLLRRISSPQEAPAAVARKIKTEISILALVAVASYATILWNLMQPVINPVIFLFAFSFGIVSSVMLGKRLSRE